MWGQPTPNPSAPCGEHASPIGSADAVSVAHTQLDFNADVAVRYVSTRGEAPELGFEDVLLTGLARDGGLYLPERWPEFAQADIARMAGQPYEAVALEVIRPFVGGDVAETELSAIITEAYASFSHRAVTPLIQI